MRSRFLRTSRSLEETVFGGILAILLFYYRFLHGVWSWDLFAVAVTIVTVKVALMIWFRLTD